jgi:hypothetical protein
MMGNKDQNLGERQKTGGKKEAAVDSRAASFLSAPVV